MNGSHDLGGRHGHGPIEPEADEPVFHDEWERRAFALTLAMGATGQWNIDASRHARESIGAVNYLSKSYYAIWLAGLEALLLERGLLREGEIEAGKVLGDIIPLSSVLTGDMVAPTLARGASTGRENCGPSPFFKPGDSVRARVANPAGHTRLPAYARGRRGTIERVHGTFVFADANAAGKGETPQPCYSVGFPATALWGPDGDPKATVFVDLWQDHLESANDD
ncbi:MAG: nitrile hydratase subunit beta [Alphaproteobacteria bacterium]